MKPAVPAARHILVISQYFYPEDFRINHISQEWIERGYKVTVITGIPNYPQGKFFAGYGLCKRRKEHYQGIEIIRIPLIPRGSKKITLILNYLSFVVTGFCWQLFTRLQADHVFIFEVSPMSQALPGVWFARKRKIPCSIYVQDLWPENIEIVAKVKNPRIINLVGKMTDYIYARCDHIFTTSRSFITAIAKRGVPLDKLIYWPQYAEDIYQPQPRQATAEILSDGSFNLTFTGNIGYAQGLDILVETAALLKKSSAYKFRFNLVGDGRFKKDLQQMVSAARLEDVFNFIERQPAARVPLLLAASDAAFLSLSDSPLFAMTIPAKLQTYLACGVAIVAVATGETQEILASSQAGVCSPPGDAQQLADNLNLLAAKSQSDLRQLGQNARQYYLNNFDKKALLDLMDTYLQK